MSEKAYLPGNNMNSIIKVNSIIARISRFRQMVLGDNLKISEEDQ